MTFTIRNQLQPSGMFATPESMPALQDYLSKFNGGEALAANVALGMTWNFCAKVTKNMVHEHAAQLAIYLDSGLRSFLMDDEEGEFNEWFNGSGDVERTNKTVEIASHLLAMIPEDCDVPWSTTCYILVGEHLPMAIIERYRRGYISDGQEILKCFQSILNTELKKEQATA
jgi:hypothetical protein